MLEDRLLIYLLIQCVMRHIEGLLDIILKTCFLDNNDVCEVFVLGEECNELQ
jgi:hypothetical protein